MALTLGYRNTNPFIRRPYEAVSRCLLTLAYCLRLLYSMIESSIVEGMPRRESPIQSEMIQGTLDMLVLQTLMLGPAHGHTIAYAIERRSEDVLQIEHGSLYPALYRLEDRGWIAAFWGTSENNRKAKYYRLTPAGRKQLAIETSRWERLAKGIGRILRPATE